MWAEFEWENKVRALEEGRSPSDKTHDYPPHGNNYYSRVLWWFIYSATIKHFISLTKPSYLTKQVSVNTTLWDLNEYLQSLISATNMACLTPERALQGDCGFLAANLYAKSIFGEHAVANVSIERHSSSAQPQQRHSHITGHIRIRAKSQGMAICIGDKMNQVQRQATPSATQAQQAQQQPPNAQAQQMPPLIQASA